jgi:tRNA pseudouridine13 synthase
VETRQKQAIIVTMSAIMRNAPSPANTAAAAAGGDVGCTSQQQQQEPQSLDPTEVSLGISAYLSSSSSSVGFSAISKARYSDFVVHEGACAYAHLIASLVEREREREKFFRPSCVSLCSRRLFSASIFAVTAARLVILLLWRHTHGRTHGHTHSHFSPVSSCTVALDGTIARLESMEPTIVGMDAATVERGNKLAAQEQTQTLNEKKRKREENTLEDWMFIQTQLEGYVGKESAEEVVTFLQGVDNVDLEQNSPESAEKFVLLPALSDKDTRRKLHHFIRERMSSTASADTVDGGQIRVWHSNFVSDMPNTFDRQRSNNNNARSNSKGKFIQFVLYKENIDTGVAMQQISQRLGGGKTIRLGYAGNKDKRGITSQFVTIPARDHFSKQLCRAFNTSTSDGGGGHTTTGGRAFVRVGNFQLVPNELKLGRLRGNRFDVALRNVQVHRDTTDTPTNNRKNAIDALHMAASSIRETGFVNYFGLQRFGKFHDTHLTGMALLRGDHQEAIEVIMRPKPDERPDILEARQQWQNRFSDPSIDRATAERQCANAVLKKMTRFMQSEAAIVRALARNPLDYRRAFGNIARTMRMMFLHSVQSLLWNKVSTHRIETFGLNVVPGDLVLVDDAGAEDRRGCPDVKVVTDEDIQSGRYTIEDVVLPLIGSETQDPENGCGAMYDEILKEYSVTREMFGELDRDSNCEGDYRKLVCRPKDIDFTVVEYKNELEPLLQTDFMKINGIEAVPKMDTEKDADSPVLLAMVVGFSLPSSSYATIFLRELTKRPTSSEYQRDLNLGRDDGIRE